jgi:hypothetical protein
LFDTGPSNAPPEPSSFFLVFSLVGLGKVPDLFAPTRASRLARKTSWRAKLSPAVSSNQKIREDDDRETGRRDQAEQYPDVNSVHCLAFAETIALLLLCDNVQSLSRVGTEKRGVLAHVLAPIHPKAMPVILRNEAEFEGWLTESVDVALAL